MIWKMDIHRGLSRL